MSQKGGHQVGHKKSLHFLTSLRTGKCNNLHKNFPTILERFFQQLRTIFVNCRKNLLKRYFDAFLRSKCVNFHKFWNFCQDRVILTRQQNQRLRTRINGKNHSACFSLATSFKNQQQTVFTNKILTRCKF